MLLPLSLGTMKDGEVVSCSFRGEVFSSREADMSEGHIRRELRLVIAIREPGIRERVKKLSVELGHVVVAVYEHAKECTEGCLELPHIPDLLLTDMVTMPLLDAMESVFLQRRVSVPFILISSEVSRLLERDKKGRVFGRYVFPLSVDQLKVALQQAADQSDHAKQQKSLMVGLQEKLADIRDREQAKRILMELLHLTEEQAYERLKSLATSNGMTLGQKAKEVIAARKVFELPPKKERGKPKPPSSSGDGEG